MKPTIRGYSLTDFGEKGTDKGENALIEFRPKELTEFGLMISISDSARQYSEQVSVVTGV